MTSPRSFSRPRSILKCVLSLSVRVLLFMLLVVAGDVERNPGPQVVPLTTGHMTRVMEKTRSLNMLCNGLDIPQDKRGSAASAAEYYVHHSTEPNKVRWMIYWLDYREEPGLADSVMECAEPPADPSLTPQHTVPVFKAITGDWEKISDSDTNIPLVPPARARLIREKFNAVDQLREAAHYYTLYGLGASWKVLCGSLYRARETAALQIARPHLQTVRDPSLTPDNILQVTRNIPLWKSDYSYDYLDMSRSQHEEISRMYDGEKAKYEVVSAWLAGHPCPSWDHVKYLLWWLEDDGRGRKGAEDEVNEKYLTMTPEKAKQILDDSLQDGSVPQSCLKAVGAGPARSGKTLTKKHVFKIPHDSTFSCSTGVSEAPIHAIRSFSCQMINTSVPEWVPLSPEMFHRLLARKLRYGLLRGNVAKAAAEIIKSFRESSQEDKRTSLTPAPEPAAASSTASAGESKSRDLVASALCEENKDEEELFKLQMILFLDSGGQPQFHELLPAVSHNVCLVMLFVKLNERLDAQCCTAFTDEEGKWFQEQCPSLLTNEQVLVQFVHTMMCKPLAQCEGRHAMFMVIGTHKDLINQCDETLAQKNERLASLFLPALEEVLIMNGDKVIFAINALEPDKEDEKCFDLIRHKVSEVGLALEQVTPMSFLMFQNDLIRYGQEHGKRVVSMGECEAIAGRLKMDRQGLEAALIHFNMLSMFLYMPSVLPGRVFLDPQMALDSVNRVLGHSYKVGCGAVPGLAPAESRLWKEGVVTSEMLDGDMFSSCFVGGLFEAKDALKLFYSLYIAAPLSESEFIMPAMLQTLLTDATKQYLPAPSEHVAPLLLHFHKSRIASGVFCSTHTCMRSKYGWKTCYVVKRGKKVPACLYRNAVKLQHPSKPIKVVFIHAQKHFEVHVDAAQAELPSVCPQIRDMLLAAVDSAARVFRYTNSRASVAFQCPCSPDDVHTATPTDDLSHLKCTITESISRAPLTEGQKVWLGRNPDAVEASSKPGETRASENSTETSDDNSSAGTEDHSSSTGQSTETGEGVTAQHGGGHRASAPSSSPHTTSTADNTSSTHSQGPTLPQLISLPTRTGETINIVQRVGTRYTLLGIVLLNDKDGSIVNQITTQHQLNAVNITLEILMRWIRGEGKQPVTWNTLTDTLAAIGLTELAKSILESL